MRVDTLTDTLGLGDLICDECGCASDAITEQMPARLVSVVCLTRRRFQLCDDCLEGLRSLIRKRRGRRPLSPRSRRALTRLAQNPAEHVSYGDLSAAIGKYATNVIVTLLERKLLEQHGEHVRAATFTLTPAGSVAIDTLELASR